MRKWWIALALVLGGWTFVPYTPLQKIELGYTTASDIGAMLGRPNRRTMTASGEELWRYTSVNLGPGTQGTGQFYFSDGILTRCVVHQTVGMWGPLPTPCLID